MRAWTVHAAARRATVPSTSATLAELVPEGFCWMALLFGPLWLLARGLWFTAAVALLAIAAAYSLRPDLAAFALLILNPLLWLTAHDLRRWSLGRQGMPVAGVVVAPDRDAAIRRLWASRPDLARGLAT